MTPLERFKEIQKMQEKLDNARQQQAKYSKIVRSLSQKIPEMIRDASL